MTPLFLSPSVPIGGGIRVHGCLHFDFDVHAGWEIEIRQVIDRFGGGVDDVDQAFVDPHFVLVARVLVDKRGAIDRHFVDLGGQGDRSRNLGAAPFRRFHDFPRRLVNDLVIVRFDFNSHAQSLRGVGLFGSHFKVTKDFTLYLLSSRE